MTYQFGREGGAVAAAVDSQSPPCGHGMNIGLANHQGPQAAQLLLKQARSAITAEGPEAVTADQFGAFTAVVGR